MPPLFTPVELGAESRIPATPVALSPWAPVPLSRIHERRKKRAFSLIEISLALAIVAFAFVALLGLLPMGMTNFNEAMNTQTAAAIYQRVAAEYLETDFDDLLASKKAEGGNDAGRPYYRFALRYFDIEGQEIRPTTAENPTAAERKRIVFTVYTRASLPGNANPDSHTGSVFTSLPQLSGARFNPRHSSFLTIQVAYTPNAENVLEFQDNAKFLLNSDIPATPGSPARKLSMRTYSLLVTRNGYFDPTINNPVAP